MASTVMFSRRSQALCDRRIGSGGIPPRGISDRSGNLIREHMVRASSV